MCYKSTSYNARYEKFAKDESRLSFGTSVYSLPTTIQDAKLNHFWRNANFFENSPPVLS